MRTELKSLCEDFIENRDAVKKAYRMENAYLHPVCAVIFMNNGIKADLNRLSYCGSLLKKNTGAFSSFRGISRPVTVSMLSVGDPEKKIKKALAAYTSLKKYFSANAYLPLTAMLISDKVDEGDFYSVSQRSKEIYDLMRGEHPFLTSAEDCVFAALIALSGQRPSDAITETERCYLLLKEKFFSANAVQSLSHVLALCEGPAEDKCRKTVELFDALKANGMRYGTEYELSTLGVLAMLPDEQSEIISDLAEVDGFLSSQKGYGFWGLGKRQRLMHAGMIVTAAHLSSKEPAESTMALSAQQAAIAAAQQAAICAAIAAQTASNAATH